MRVLVVDNLSPLTPDILVCLERLGVKHIYRKFSEVTFSDITTCDKVILSGRRKNDKKINLVNSKIVRQCLANGKPLLGICYGAEIIALTLGGTIRKMPYHIQGMVTVSVSSHNPLTLEKESISAYESHSYCVARLPAGFKSLASSQYCEHEIFSDGKIFGTQFHPEKSGSDGLKVLYNFTTI
ncbi:MAG TPA: gamma-glutamyl-gamma-aminobutyrate hydrolase family protein [Nitrososphaera sp.]|nr:gamma-glutamyl-gamma-aminobutyrate hydrolase family protein [Nitrososphaera sp.]